LTADSHVGDVVISLHTVYTQGKHDAVVQVQTGSGRPQGELSVILLFTPYDSPKKKPSTPVVPQPKPITPSSSPGYPIGSTSQSASTGFATNPGMPRNQVPTAPPPPAFPMAANVVAAPQQAVSYVPLPQTAQMHVASGYYSPTLQPQSPIAIVPQTQVQPVQYQAVPGFVQTPQFPPPTGYLPAQTPYNGGYLQPNYPAPPPGGLPPTGFQ